MVLNTEMSLTELSSKVNGNTSGKPQAFKLLKLVAPTQTTDAGAGGGTDPVGD
jgi:hypothetical protein